VTCGNGAEHLAFGVSHVRGEQRQRQCGTATVDMMGRPLQEMKISDWSVTRNQPNSQSVTAAAIWYSFGVL